MHKICTSYHSTQRRCREVFLLQLLVTYRLGWGMKITKSLQSHKSVKTSKQCKKSWKVFIAMKIFRIYKPFGLSVLMISWRLMLDLLLVLIYVLISLMGITANIHDLVVNDSTTKLPKVSNSPKKKRKQ